MNQTTLTDWGITEGGIYVYQCSFPKGCAGHHYKAHRLILDVPSYQHKVLVEALTGKDRGLWFCCTVANFKTRYGLLESAEVGPS